MPQVLVNVEVEDAVKQAWREGKMEEMLSRYEAELTELGWRLLVRASGTEPLMRVTIWGDDASAIEAKAEEIADKIKEYK